MIILYHKLTGWVSDGKYRGWRELENLMNMNTMLLQFQKSLKTLLMRAWKTVGLLGR